MMGARFRSLRGKYAAPQDRRFAAVAAGALRAMARRNARRTSNHKEHKGHKETGATGARQICRATGPTDCGCAAGALRAMEQ